MNDETDIDGPFQNGYAVLYGILNGHVNETDYILGGTAARSGVF